jgi:hypothetical protein
MGGGAKKDLSAPAKSSKYKGVSVRDSIYYLRVAKETGQPLYKPSKR